MKKVLLISPVYNEAKTLEIQVEKVLDWCKSNLKKYEWQYAIVDNASTDATKLGKQLEKKYKKFKYFRLNEKGRGLALKWVWGELDFDFSLYMDIDLSADLKHIKEVMEKLEAGSDLVVGSRWLKQSIVLNRNFRRTFMSFGYKTMVKLFTRSKVSDFQCGFKGVRKDFITQVINGLKDDKWFFDTELILTAKREGYKVSEVAIKWIDDPNSSVDFFKDSWNMFYSLLTWTIKK